MNNYDARNWADNKTNLKQDRISSGNAGGVTRLFNDNIIRAVIGSGPLTITTNGLSHFTFGIEQSFLDQSYTNVETNSLLDSFYNTGAISKAFVNKYGENVSLV